MKKPKVLVKGDKIAIVSMYSSMLGENFAKYKLDLGLNGMKEFGLVSVVRPNTLKGIEY